MKKQSGFTLIELMVVMAIIAILATAGLAAYTGYIKKARDTTRISDIAAINSVILSNMTATGKSPISGAAVNTAVLAANNSQPIKDPLTTKSTCLDSLFNASNGCEYYYQQCDYGTGFEITAPVESTSNASSAYYDSNLGDQYYFKVGSCTTRCGGTGGCTTNGAEAI